MLHADQTYGGATHDSFIFNYSVLWDHLEALTNAGKEVVLLCMYCVQNHLKIVNVTITAMRQNVPLSPKPTDLKFISESQHFTKLIKFYYGDISQKCRVIWEIPFV